MLELKSVSKAYGKKAVLSDISRSFTQGVSVMTGRSGAGKSTLLRLCATAEKPSSGDVLWQGQSIVKKPRPLRSVLGYAPQRIDFPEDISAIDFLLHMAALKNIRRKAGRAQAQALLDRLGLGRDSESRIQTFSGGMRRRLGLAQAFLGTPQCLALDEPTAELDPETARIVHELIFEMAETAVVIMTTHLEGSLDSFQYDTFHVEAVA